MAGTYYVYAGSVKKNGTFDAIEQWGPYPLTKAKQFARIGSQTGKKRAVTRGAGGRCVRIYSRGKRVYPTKPGEMRGLTVGEKPKVPAKKKAPAKRKPAAKRKNPDITLPAKISSTKSYSAHGKKLSVKRKSAGSYFLRIVGQQRARWGNAKEAREDIGHFQTYGTLPAAATPAMSNNPKKKAPAKRKPARKKNPYAGLGDDPKHAQVGDRVAIAMPGGSIGARPAYFDVVSRVGGHLGLQRAGSGAAYALTYGGPTMFLTKAAGGKRIYIGHSDFHFVDSARKNPPKRKAPAKRKVAAKKKAPAKKNCRNPRTKHQVPVKGKRVWNRVQGSSPALHMLTEWEGPFGKTIHYGSVVKYGSKWMSFTADEIGSKTVPKIISGLTEAKKYVERKARRIWPVKR